MAAIRLFEWLRWATRLGAGLFPASPDKLLGAHRLSVLARALETRWESPGVGAQAATAFSAPPPRPDAASVQVQPASRAECPPYAAYHACPAQPCAEAHSA